MLETTILKIKEKEQIKLMIQELVKKEIESQIFNKIELVKGKDSEIPGPKGDKGEQGESIQGKQGIQGLKGEQGLRGEQGKQGKDGISGKEGKDGLNGKDGKDGLRGSPDKPEEIVKKLNKTEESIKISVIKGLETQIKNILSSLREKKGGGGGMGNWIHQSFSTNSSTTTITLSNNIAANGFAVLAFYNGQFIVRGTHYTQSGKVLTLTFTPEDNTNIDVAFVRG